MRTQYLIAGLLAAAISCGPGAVKERETVLKIYALKYGESLYPATLVNTDAQGKTVPLNWLAYLVESSAGYTLIDCGFSDARLLKRFGIRKFKPVSSILTAIGIPPEKIETIIITHTHFDHALDVDKFPNARIILHELELASPEDPALISILPRLRVQPITATFAVGPLSIEPVRGHTKGSLVVRVPASGSVFTGDECYFAAACLKKIPLPKAAAFSPEANRRFIEGLSAQTKIYAGHETALVDGRWISDYAFFFF